MNPELLILVVDDDHTVRTNTVELLELSGYRVSAHPDATSALAWCSANRGGAAAALIDLSLPDMSGVGLLRALQDIQPDLPVIIMTGSAGDETTVALRGLPLAGVLKKPTRSSQMLATLAAALGKAQP